MSGESQATSQSSVGPDDSLSAQLTIITVGLEKHYDYIRRQLKLIDALNPGAACRFLVVDNAPRDGPHLTLDDPRCVVLEGVDATPLPERGRGSYHHAAAINLAMPHVRTRYVLVMDPDLFVVRPGWIDQCLDHMRRRGLAVFGVPWHSRWVRKWRDFPCVHFMLIDLHKAPIGQIDFTPALVEDLDADSRPLSVWLKAHVPRLNNRILIGSRRDTGWRLRKRFGRGHRIELALPVVDFDQELPKPPHLLTLEGRRLEHRLPRRWSYLPRPDQYVMAEDAPAFHGAPFKRLGPEKFMWRGEPFCFHLRRNARDRIWGLADQSLERDDLDLLLNQVSTGRPWTDWSF